MRNDLFDQSLIALVNDRDNNVFYFENRKTWQVSVDYGDRQDAINAYQDDMIEWETIEDPA